MQCEPRKDDVIPESTVATVDKENITSGRQQEDEYDEAILRTKKVSEKLADEIISEHHNFHGNNPVSSRTSIDEMSPMEMMTAEMTREELVEELLFKYEETSVNLATNISQLKRKVSKRREKKIGHLTKNCREKGKSKRPPLILPPGWDVLEVGDMVEEIRSFNNISEDSKDDRLENILKSNTKPIFWDFPR